jgi:hypothetical protein
VIKKIVRSFNTVIKRQVNGYLVGKRLEAHPNAVVGGGLESVSHPPFHMVEPDEPKCAIHNG